MEYALAAITYVKDKRTIMTVAVFEHRHEAEAVMELIENTALDGAALATHKCEAPETE